MATSVTIDIFSGRPNPNVVLRGHEEREFLARLRPAEPLGVDDRLTYHESGLGYRGLIVEQHHEPAEGLPGSFRVAHGELLGTDLAHRPSDLTVEDYFIGTEGAIGLLDVDTTLRDFMLNEVERSRATREQFQPKRIVFPETARCPAAQLYEPAWWNVPARQPRNNCYNYATNYRTDTFAQPGLAAGAEYASATCSEVVNAAVKDDLIAAPDADNQCPDEGHLAALVVAPGFDFHWYRMSRNGYWTHKPGSTPATNIDNTGATIRDPRTADRGPYTDFCSFFVVMHGHIKIR